MTPRTTVLSSSEVVEVGGGTLLAVGPVVTFFTWWSWWAMAGIVLTLAGVLWLVAMSAAHDRNGAPG
ncbi:hypothetical protein ACIQUM_21180 [Amycolatopsis azurea]|uniref:hypothetical protein n=1 Tax=Amycolatopsis azurea TaxID=36819 RepID=UPI00380721E1